MARRVSRTVPAATALPESSETMSGGGARAKMVRERSTGSKSLKTAKTVSPAQCEIGAVAHQLWLDDGCRVGSDQEHWFRAEAMLKNALAKGEALSIQPSIRADIRIESEIQNKFRWEGHWEVWESEWAGARWVWD
jgi:hypothetical protein